MKKLQELQPSIVWDYFGQICQVPRPSKKEEKIIDFLIQFAKKHNLSYKTDDAGNVVISKPASKGFEKMRPVVLQSHMDMVCEKNSDLVFDFDTQPIIPVVDGEWVRAEGTTLGADDGIGIAAQLAILASDNIKHGPLECLFTVDEETGLTGAFELKPGFFESRILLNLDSEDEGELFIGCAGGIDSVATMKYQQVEVPKPSVAFKMMVKGLKGGHSGDDIDKARGNSNKILVRFLWNALRKFNISLHSFDGGNLRNAIPREATAVFVVAPDQVGNLKEYFIQFAGELKAEFKINEPHLSFTFEETPLPSYVIDKETFRKLLNALYACPHGVIAMSQSMPGLVETSTNLASVKFIEDNTIVISTSQRSSVNSAKTDIAAMVECAFILAGAQVTHGQGYPGWAPDVNSEILQITRSAYKKLFMVEPKVRAIHAGLECGLFLEKYPDMDMISFGPTLRGVHSPDEKINIETVQKFWDLLLEVLVNIPEKA